MSTNNKILEIITEIRNSHSEMVNIFSKGSCYNLFLILKLVFPEAEAYYNSDHIITKIGEKFYDINEGWIYKTGRLGGPLGDGNYYPSHEDIMRNNPAR